MVLVKSLDDSKNEVEFYLDENLKKNLDEIKDSVLNKGWDYVFVVSGIVGVGKSTLTQAICKYLDPTFNTKERICFEGNGEDGLLERTSNANKGTAFMLDESFADLNTKVSKGSEFVRIINHLQLIRQRGLFIGLCLPNFFDLSKGVAIFRASHLFVVYHDNFKRGFFAAFGREEKKKLYVKGNKFMDYNCVEPNFRGRFVKGWVADEKLYEKLKYAHLKRQAEEKGAISVNKDMDIRDKLITFLCDNGFKPSKVAEITGLTTRTIYNIIKNSQKNKEKHGESG